MAWDFLNPRPQIPDPTPEQQASLYGRWMERLRNPDIRAGMLQAGIQLMQPLPLGQDFLGSLGSAIGAGAEAVDARRASRNEATKAAQDAAAEAERLRLTGEANQSEAAYRSGQLDIDRARLPIQQQEADAASIRAQSDANILKAGEVVKARDRALTRYYKLLEDNQFVPDFVAPDMNEWVTQDIAIQLGDTEIGAGPAAPATIPPVTPGDTPAPAPKPGPAMPQVTLAEYRTRFPDQMRAFKAAADQKNYDELIRLLLILQSRVTDPGSVQPLIDDAVSKKGQGRG